MGEPIFKPLPDKPDHPRLEEEVLARWEAEGTFAKLREQNAGGPTFSFIDGPVTANKPLGVHTTWGRTLKDVFQRYKALRGFDQRYQNGFDCQGSGSRSASSASSASTRSARSRSTASRSSPRSAARSSSKSSEELTRGSKRLGQWMDWGNDYFTFSDTNIEYVWRILKIVHERGWLYWPPLDGVVPALRHVDLAARADHRGVYRPRRPVALRPPAAARPAGRVARRLDDDPWTLPANVAAAVNPEAEYGRRLDGEWVAVARYPDEEFAEKPAGLGARRLALQGPFDELAPGARRAPRHPVGRRLAGRGHRHRPHRARLRRRGLRALARARPAVLMPVDESGRFYDDFGWLHGLSTVEAAEQIIGNLEEKGRPRRGGPPRAPLSRVLALPHAAHLPHRRRLVHLRPTTCGSRCSTRTRRSSGRPSTWASAWTTGSATWATGTSPAAATTACRCRSTRARAGI